MRGAIPREATGPKPSGWYADEKEAIKWI